MIGALIIVHGMGVHGADWATSVVAELRKAARPFGLDGAFSSAIEDDKVALLPVSYDDRFADWLGKWGNDSRELAKYVRTHGIGIPPNILAWLETADAKENNFLWSHVVDVLLYRFFSTVTTDVRVHVARDIARHWRDALAADPAAEVSVLAHSLGTSVTHDTLGLLATDPPPRATGFLSGNRRLTHLFLLANVSRILETSPRVYESVIAPPSARGDGAYCGNLVNVRHELDPFPAPRAFRPAWTGDDFLDIRTSAVRDFNVHGFEHYIRDPRVHVPILRSLFGFDAIDPQVAQARIQEYDAESGPPCQQRLREFVQDCRQRVRLIEDSAEVKTLLSAGVQFLNDVKEVRAACREET